MSGIVLFNHKINSIHRYHPWIFSGAIKRLPKNIEEGEWVEVFDESGHFLGAGHYSTGSISVRLISFEPHKSFEETFEIYLKKAIELRKRLGLWYSSETNAFRLIHGEGDRLPGLIVDIYDTTAVVQAHSTGMFRSLPFIASALVDCSEGRIQCVFNKSKSTLKTEISSDGIIAGQTVCKEICENGNIFEVDISSGQKTGFFLDQRENRKLLSRYSNNKKILNTFCYTGGFSVYAAAGGASLVHSVDSSEKAVALAHKNMLRNGFSTHEVFISDVFEFLSSKTEDRFYDIIVLDPPAFAKSQRSRHKAIQAYKRLNLLAMQKIASSGLIFTFSCSQAVSKEMFEGAVAAAAIECGRPIQILHHLCQPPDHPVNIFHPEGEYLKGLVLHVS